MPTPTPTLVVVVLPLATGLSVVSLLLAEEGFDDGAASFPGFEPPLEGLDFETPGEVCGEAVWGVSNCMDADRGSFVAEATELVRLAIDTVVALEGELVFGSVGAVAFCPLVLGDAAGEDRSSFFGAAVVSSLALSSSSSSSLLLPAAWPAPASPRIPPRSSALDRPAAILCDPSVEAKTETAIENNASSRANGTTDLGYLFALMLFWLASLSYCTSGSLRSGCVVSGTVPIDQIACHNCSFSAT